MKEIPRLICSCDPLCCTGQLKDSCLTQKDQIFIQKEQILIQHTAEQPEKIPPFNWILKCYFYLNNRWLQEKLYYLEDWSRYLVNMPFKYLRKRKVALILRLSCPGKCLCLIFCLFLIVIPICNLLEPSSSYFVSDKKSRMICPMGLPVDKVNNYLLCLWWNFYHIQTW